MGFKDVKNSGGLEACKTHCDKTAGCNSFAFCQGTTQQLGEFVNCNMKDKIIKGTEPTKSHYACKTYYRNCSKYHKCKKLAITCVVC